MTRFDPKTIEKHIAVTEDVNLKNNVLCLGMLVQQRN